MGLDSFTRVIKNMFSTSKLELDGGINLTTNQVDIGSNELLSAIGVKYYPDNQSLCVVNSMKSKYVFPEDAVEGLGWLTPRSSATAGLTPKVPIYAALYASPTEVAFKKWDTNTVYPYVTEVGRYSSSSSSVSVVRFTEFNNVLITTDGYNKPRQILNYSPYTVSEITASVAGARFSIVFNNYLFFGGFSDDPTKVIFSAVGDHTTYPATNYFYIGAAGDADPVTGFALCYNNLIIFRKKSIYVLTGTSSTDFTLSPLTYSLGMPADMACCSVQDECWFINDIGPYKITSSMGLIYMGEKIKSNFIGKAIMTDGTGIIAISQIVYSQKTNCVYLAYPTSASDTTAKIYLFNLNKIDSSGNPVITEIQTQLKLNYKNFTIQKVNGPYIDQYDVNNEQIVGIDPISGVLIWTIDSMWGDSSSLSYAQPQFMTIQTRYYNLGSYTNTKKIRFIHFLGNIISSSPLTLTIYCKKTMSPAETPQSYSITTFNMTENKWAVPASANFTGKYFSFKIVNQAEVAGLLNGLIIEYVDFGRRL